MIYFLLPNIYNIIESKNLTLELSSDENITIQLNKKLANYLNKSKKNINNYIDSWDNAKKYTNSYEFIHTSIPNYKGCISKYNPISRAFYKIIEIINTFNLNDSCEIKSMHLAEAPGGFIEALCYLRENYKNEKYIGISLMDNTKKIPSWKNNSVLHDKYKDKVKIEYGKTNDGDLYKTENYVYMCELYSNKMNLITADGGFDFSDNFEMQEKNMLRLIYTEIIYALSLQKKGGNFVLKIFDIFLTQTLQYIYLLSLCYDEVYIVKPSTSRSANSEKYVVCKNFKLDCSMELIKEFTCQLEQIEKSKNKFIKNIFSDYTIPNHFINSVKELNSIIGQNQLENINSTIMIIEQPKRKDRMLIYIKENITKCIEWCKENKIEYEKNIEKNNIFTRKN